MKHESRTDYLNREAKNLDLENLKCGKCGSRFREESHWTKPNVYSFTNIHNDPKTVFFCSRKCKLDFINLLKKNKKMKKKFVKNE
jgi:hypothetical protein